MTNYEQQNVELVKKFQNGDEYAFTELFNLNQKAMMKVLSKYQNLRYVDEQQKISACYNGLLKAAEKYDTENPTATFSHFMFRGMGQMILQENTRLESKGRKSMLHYSDYINTGSEGAGNRQVSIDKIGGDIDYYFFHEYPSTKDAIQYALSRCKQEKMKPYLTDVLIGEMTQQELADILGETRQMLSYHIKKFKADIKDCLLKEELA